MPAQYNFTHQLPNNSKKLKRAFIGLIVAFILCIAGMVIAELLWDQFTYPAYSLRYRRNITGGWPPKVFNWSLWLAVAIVICAPMMFFMQDFKNPSMGLTKDALFLNQQLMRNTLIPFTNIKTITQEGNKYKIIFHDDEMVLNQQVKLFKPFIKSNLSMGNFWISETHTAGDVKSFMEELKRRVPAA